MQKIKAVLTFELPTIVSKGRIEKYIRDAITCEKGFYPLADALHNGVNALTIEVIKEAKV